MKRKILILISSIVAALCCVGIVVLIPFSIKGLSFPEIGNHFKKGDKTYTLTVETTDGGSVNITSGEYKADEVINLQATPDDGYVFTGWYDASEIYITTSNTYNLSISEETKLFAKFGLEPEEITGTAAYCEELKNCSETFSFTVNCARDDAETYLQENLQVVDDFFVGTEWEDDERANVSFTVEKIGEEQYLITPTTKYDAGTTYTAKLKETPTEPTDEISFAENVNEGDSLTFSVTQEETNIVEVQNGIVYLSLATADNEIVSLVDDGKIEGDEGDVADKVTLTSSFGMTEGSIFCIYSGETNEDGSPLIDENTIYGKCTSITENNGYYEVVYGAPELHEIYSQLDIYMNEEIDFEEAGAEISEETIEQIKHMFLEQEDVQLLVAAFHMTAEEQFKDSEYDAELLASNDLAQRIEIEVTPKIWGKTASIDIALTLNVPIKKNGNEVAQLAFKIAYMKELSLNATFNYKLRYWWIFPTGIKSYDINATVATKDNFSFGIYFSEFNDTDALKNLDECFDQEMLERKCLESFADLKKSSIVKADSIKEIFKKGGYDGDGLRKDVNLFTIRHYFGIVSVSFEVNFFVDLDISGSLYYTSTSSSYSTVGIRSSNGGAGKPYINKGGSEHTSNLVITGNIGVETGVEAKTYFSVAGLAKYLQAGVGVETGAYASMEGYVSLRSGQNAGCLESGLFFGGYAYYKVFSISGQWDFGDRAELVLVRVGYDKTLTSWTYYEELSDDDYYLSLINKETELFELEKLKANVYSTGEGVATEYLDWNSNQYQIKVEVVGGQYLEYKDGNLVVKNNAPLYFQDAVKITVKSANVWSPFKANSYCSYLQTLQFNVTYGDEDAYYKAKDSDIEEDFRELYRSYNASNVKILEDMLDNLIDTLIADQVQNVDVYEVIVREYLNALFDTIGEYRALEDDKRTMENKFVNEEAEAFVAVIDWVNGMQAEKEYDDELFKDIILDVENSTVLYETLVNINDTEEYQTLAANFKLSKEVKASVNESLAWYLENSTNKTKAEKIVEIFTNLLKLDE